MASKISRERIERAARIYATNKDAAFAMGIHPHSFHRLCKEYGIETPNAHRAREKKDNAAI